MFESQWYEKEFLVHTDGISDDGKSNVVTILNIIVLPKLML